MPGITGDEMVEYAQLCRLDTMTPEQEKRFWELDRKFPHPLTPGQVVTQHMAEPVHVTLTRNAKGDFQFEVSVHTADEEENLKIVHRIEEILSRDYPKPKSKEGT